MVVLVGSQGGALFLMSEVPLHSLDPNLESGRDCLICVIFALPHLWALQKRAAPSGNPQDALVVQSAERHI